MINSTSKRTILSILVICLFSVSSFLVGIYAGTYKGTIFYFVRSIKDTFYSKSLQGRFTQTRGKEKGSIQVNQDVLIAITYGQSHTANSTELYRVKNENVLNFYLNSLFVYEDPSLGTNGSQTSVWGLVGDHLINNGDYDKVIFANTGYGGRSIKELAADEYFNYFATEYKNLLKSFGRVDAILLHQGGSNHYSRKGSMSYEEDFHRLMKRIDSLDVGAQVIMAISSFNIDKKTRLSTVDTILTLKQNNVIQQFDNVCLGPNADLFIFEEDRIGNGNIHFSDIGANKLALEWVNSINRCLN